MPDLKEIPNEVLGHTMNALQKAFPGRALVLLVATPIPGDRTAIKYVSNVDVEGVKTVCRGFLDMAQGSTAGNG